MTTRLEASDVSDRSGLDDWRVLVGRLDATFSAGSFSDAASFASAVAEAADAADHHPDLDIRYPAVVHVALTTHEVGGLSELDVELARTISEIAERRGVTTRSAPVQACEIAIDAMDLGAVRPFWQAVFGYRASDEDALVDPLRIGPAIWFQQMDVPRPQRNRIHLDVWVPHDAAPARLEAALAAGGTLIDDAAAPSLWVLADVEGNEACICTWQSSA